MEKYIRISLFGIESTENADNGIACRSPKLLSWFHGKMEKYIWISLFGIESTENADNGIDLMSFRKSFLGKRSSK